MRVSVAKIACVMKIYGELLPMQWSIFLTIALRFWQNIFIFNTIRNHHMPFILPRHCGIKFCSNPYSQFLDTATSLSYHGSERYSTMPFIKTPKSFLVKTLHNFIVNTYGLIRQALKQRNPKLT